MSGTRIHRCTAADAAALSLVGQATFLETFAGILRGQDIVAHCADAHSADLYRTWLADPDLALWLMRTCDGDAPIGYMVISLSRLPVPDASPNDLELKRIYLLGKFSGRGLGKRLLAEAIAHARTKHASRLLLGVYAHNDAAIGFYRRAGFEKVGDRRFKVGGCEYDDHIMSLSLNH